MPSVEFLRPLAAAAAFLAGAINSVAGGGTMISFPTLVWLGLPSIAANATSTVAIWPGSLGSIWGFRSEFGKIKPRLKLLSGSYLCGWWIGTMCFPWESQQSLAGYGAAGLAKRVGRVAVRRFGIAVGLGMSVVLLIRVF